MHLVDGIVEETCAVMAQLFKVMLGDCGVTREKLINRLDQEHTRNGGSRAIQRSGSVAAGRTV